MEAADLNLSSIASYFSDESAAYALIESIRWPNGPVCPHCGTIDSAYHLKNQKTRSGKVSQRSLWKCKECRKQFTCTVGTIFEDSHIPLSKWLLGAFLLNTGKNGISSHELHRSLGITLKAAWFMAHRLRLAMARIPSERLLSGIVEADETYIGGKRLGKGRGRGAYEQNKAPVMILVERGGEVRTQTLPTVDGTNLRAALTANVDQKSTLMTDSNPGYRKPGRDFADHQVSRPQHQRVRARRSPHEHGRGLFQSTEALD
jgi:transposase-like protein